MQTYTCSVSYNRERIERRARASSRARMSIRKINTVKVLYS